MTLSDAGCGRQKPTFSIIGANFKTPPTCIRQFSIPNFHDPAYPTESIPRPSSALGSFQVPAPTTPFATLTRLISKPGSCDGVETEADRGLAFEPHSTMLPISIR